ncbi:acyl-CoA hydrolase [Streptomyces albus]|uniref:Acyl-CoA hydrolase n=1 Tax=Streptomyces albus (strain ATCC 21838 / DSM 41398 / FERM P-419 / JCM 4703 / NBRC 107858) TaxID=1081613 RepID=A0A0B5F6K4_STRA4|nr:acyl-CoA hydrolase [Streptomyces albus]AOU80264.1 acyl-CoA hydrolase [Streptomyces albus]AYN35979.1 acyl-CoA hydrolase [Streptomyces albus]
MTQAPPLRRVREAGAAPGPPPAAPAPSLGTDLLRLDEVDALLRRPWLTRFLYAESELALAAGLGPARRREFLAGRFAAKEAVLKVLDCGLFGPVRPRHIAVGRAASGRPLLRLTGSAEARRRELGLGTPSLSISHKQDLVFAVAFAVPVPAAPVPDPVPVPADGGRPEPPDSRDQQEQQDPLDQLDPLDHLDHLDRADELDQLDQFDQPEGSTPLVTTARTPAPPTPPPAAPAPAPASESDATDEAGPSVTLRVRIGAGEAHYGGELVAGARVLELFGDVATYLTIRTDGDEGLLTGYSSVDFTAPVRAGDFLEVTGTVRHRGRLRRTIAFEARKVVAARYEEGASSAVVLTEPQVVCRATGTSVVPVAKARAARRAG